jgi:hypothetical protein
MRPISQCSGLLDVVAAWGGTVGQTPASAGATQASQSPPPAYGRPTFSRPPFTPRTHPNYNKQGLADPLLLEHPDDSN